MTMCSGLVPPKGESGALLKATFNDGAVQGGVYMVSSHITVEMQGLDTILFVYLCYVVVVIVVVVVVDRSSLL